MLALIILGNNIFIRERLTWIFQTFWKSNLHTTVIKLGQMNIMFWIMDLLVSFYKLLNILFINVIGLYNLKLYMIIMKNR